MDGVLQLPFVVDLFNKFLQILFLIQNYKINILHFKTNYINKIDKVTRPYLFLYINNFKHKYYQEYY